MGDLNREAAKVTKGFIGFFLIGKRTIKYPGHVISIPVLSISIVRGLETSKSDSLNSFILLTHFSVKSFEHFL